MVNEQMIYDYLYNFIWCGTLTIVAATMLYAVWKLVSKKLRNHPHISYWSLKIVILLIPVVGLYLLNRYFLLLHNRIIPFLRGTVYEYSFSYISPAIQGKEWLVYGIAILWLVATVISAIGPIREKIRLRYLHRYSEPSKVLSLLLKRIKTEFGVKKRIEIYVNEQVKSPMVFRLFGYKIWIPEDTCAEEDLEVMILHELNHIVHKDLLYKDFLCLMSILLPIPWLWKSIRTDYNNYSETTCDIAVCERVVDTYGYFNLILNLLMAKKKQKYQFHNISELTKKGNNLVFRIACFERYSDRDVTTDKPVKRRTFAKLIFLSCIIIGFIAIMNFGYAKAIDYFYQDVGMDIPNTEVSIETELNLQGLELEDIDLENAKTLEWDEVADDSVLVIENGIIESNTVYVSETLNVKDKAMITCYSSNETIQLGIMLIKDGNLYKCEIIRNDMHSSCKIAEEGNYQIILYNNNNVMVNYDIGVLLY